MSITDDGIKDSLKKRASGPKEEKEIDRMTFGTIVEWVPIEFWVEESALILSSPEETVKEDVKTLRESSFYKGAQIVGLVQDTHSGLLKEVVFVEAEWNKS